MSAVENNSTQDGASHSADDDRQANLPGTFFLPLYHVRE
jgi:hypothetical protein